MADINPLYARRTSLIQLIAQATAERDTALATAVRYENQAQAATNQQDRNNAQRQATLFRQEAQRQQDRIDLYTAELTEVNRQINLLQQQQGSARESTGQTVTNAQDARAEGASTINPPSPQLTTQGGATRPVTPTVASNADRPSTQADAGTNAPLRPATVTQGTPASTAQPGPVVPNNRNADDQTGLAGTAVPGSGAYATNQRGAAAPGDDADGSNQTRRLLNQIFGSQQKIVAQDNPLDRYANYTYNVSLYIMSPAQYKRMQATKQKNIAGFQLLMQSGGAPQTQDLSAQQVDSNIGLDVDQNTLGRVSNLGRNQFFPLDFYIDDIKLTSYVQGRGTRTSHNVFEMNFKIYEPNGISFLDRLYAATAQYMPGNDRCSGQKNYAAQNYLMVIRFYGYDEYGNMVRPTGLRKQAGVGDTDAIIEKWIPFQFTSVRFRVASRITEYECTAVCPQNVIATGQARGVIPYNVELNAMTLDDLLRGTAGFATPQQAGANLERQPTSQAAVRRVDNTIAASSRFEEAQGVNTTGLTGSQFFDELGGQAVAVTAGDSPTQNRAPPKATAAKPKTTVVSGLIDALNQYQKDRVRAGELQFPDVYDIVFKDPTLASAKLVPEGLINKKNTPSIQTNDPAQKLLGNKQSLQVDSQTKSILAGTSIVQFIDLVTRNSTYMTEQQTYIIDARTGERRPNGRPADTVGWFSITTQVEPLEYDCIRKDYAYKITYVIGPYAVADPKTDWFPQSVFRGTQKRYNYWFTGENTQILDYYQDFNYLYYLVVNGPQAPKRTYTDYREFDKAAFATAAGETNQGQENNVYGPVATLADTLYSPGDTSRARLTIVGDPDWIQQGPLWAGALETNYDYRAFLVDGTINYESQEPLFEVAFNKPVDYDLNTGLMDPERSQFQGVPGQPNLAKISYTYRALWVTSNFSRGKFTQEIEGAQVFFYLPPQNTATTAPSAQASSNRGATNTARLPSPSVTDPNGSVEFTGQVGAEFGAYFGDGVTGGGAVKAPPSISRDQAPSPSSLLSLEGFPTPDQTLTPLPAPTPPSSGGQTVGPAASGPAAGASGQQIGQPVTIQVFTTSGSTVTVSTGAEIQTLYNQGQITAQTRRQAEFQLNQRISAANNPVNNAPNLQGVREY